MRQWIRDSSGQYNSKSRELGHKIETLINEFIQSKLKQELGERNWWKDGISKDIQKQCASKKIDLGTDEPDWHFLSTIHYHKIIMDNWNLLGNYFTPHGLENSGKEKRLDWIKKFNLVRQKYSHPQRENTTETEYNFLDNTYDWLITKLSN